VIVSVSERDSGVSGDRYSVSIVGVILVMIVMLVNVSEHDCGDC